MVSRECLREALWFNDTFVEFEHGLNSNLNRLRTALGDRADRPRFIETVPGRGYRFIAPVKAGPDSTPEQKIRVAVLPFVCVGEEESGFAQAMSADVVVRLAKISKSIGFVWPLAWILDGEQAAGQIARHVRAEYLITGSIWRN